MSEVKGTDTVYEGRFLRLAKRGTWEYVSRKGATGVVAIVALHDDGRLVLVEQLRPPVDRRVVELPAGLAGDTDNTESLLVAAQRELEEETGYAASNWQRLFNGYSSAGLTDEALTFFLATGLTRVGPGGGDSSEEILLHEVPVKSLLAWVAERTREGIGVDAKLFAGVYAALEMMNSEK
ncbi:MAG: NUDIX hydrolase [Phycisphaerales bacterium]